eukprot:CAMPEP_0184551628 /NCGR_PEP_ID=MMETSP0199_2-20130426/25916_1 /TAXON_ID=1112570 /ORGANISM="Thraustochytrium sp., Strain LLF1b" /LENGTH=353 /DNA_ID=CAMNT_0026946883 /DNA_START=582 /DNA_END=1643 /DNA_ORIENTATION=+
MIPSHPEKAFVNLGEELCEERVEWCQAFLTATTAHPLLVSEDIVSHFLSAPTEEWEASVTSETDARLEAAKNRVTKLLNMEEPLRSIVSSVKQSWLGFRGRSEDPAELDEDLDRAVRLHDQLCSTSIPLEVCVLPLQATGKVQNVRKRFESEFGRESAIGFAASTFLGWSRANEHHAKACKDLSESLSCFRDSEQTHVLFSRFGETLATLEKNKLALSEKLKSRSKQHASLQLIMQSVLELQGLSAALERCRPQPTDSGQDESEHRVKPTLTGFFDDAGRLTRSVPDALAQTAVQLVTSNIATAVANRKALEELQSWLLDLDPSLAQRKETNKARLQLSGARQNWNWDDETPM